MWSNKPLLFLALTWQRVLDVLEIVIWWKVKVIARRNVVVNQLCSILDNTKSFVRVILLARLDIDKMLLYVILRRIKHLLLLYLILLVCIVTIYPRL